MLGSLGGLRRWLGAGNAEAYKAMARPAVPIGRQIELSEEVPPERVLDWAAQCAGEEQEDIFEPQGVSELLIYIISSMKSSSSSLLEAF